MASAEGARSRRRRRREGMVLGRGIPLPGRLGGLGERHELPQRGPGPSPGHKRVFGIFYSPEPPLVER